MSCTEHMALSRRSLLLGGASLALWGLRPRLASAGPARDVRFLSIVLRGGMDGLNFIVPKLDTRYAGVRRDLAIPLASTLSLGADCRFRPPHQAPRAARGGTLRSTAARGHARGGSVMAAARPESGAHRVPFQAPDSLQQPARAFQGRMWREFPSRAGHDVVAANALYPNPGGPL